MKLEFGLWTLGLIGELIQRRFSKSLSVSAISRAMKVLGFTPQKPLYRAWQQDPALVQRWQHETFPAIKAAAKKAGATICCTKAPYRRRFSQPFCSAR